MAYPMLQSALRAQGFVTVEGAGFVKIVPEADGKTNPTPVGPGTVAARGDQLMTQVFTLKNESAAQLVNVLRPLIPANNTIAAYPSTNSLIITDYADNLKRIARIIETIDQGGGTEPVLVPILYASAVDLAQTLNRLLTDVGSATATSASEPTQRVQIIADARTNSVLLRSENPMRLARAKGLIEQLDTPTSRTGNVHILYLKNAEAARVAQTLRAVMTGDSSGAASQAPASPMTALGSGTGRAAAGAGERPAPRRRRAVPARRRIRGHQRRRRHDTGRLDQQRADHQCAGGDLQQSARGRGNAGRAPRPGLRRGADRRDHRGPGGRVRDPVAGAQRTFQQ
ncbi:MAG: hypothetical protein IPI73_10975 [Betaproteobacteria bacterium]|nr:hypothetical protein [Betaproteobacteria bacterium]